MDAPMGGGGGGGGGGGRRRNNRGGKSNRGKSNRGRRGGRGGGRGGHGGGHGGGHAGGGHPAAPYGVAPPPAAPLAPGYGTVPFAPVAAVPSVLPGVGSPLPPPPVAAAGAGAGAGAGGYGHGHGGAARPVDVCKNFATTSSCTFGNRCRFSHNVKSGGSTNVKGEARSVTLFAPGQLFLVAVANSVQVYSGDMKLQHTFPLDGVVDKLHLEGSFMFASYTAVVPGISSVPVGMIKAYNLAAKPPAEYYLVRGKLPSHSQRIVSMSSAVTEVGKPPVLFSGSFDGAVRMWQLNAAGTWDHQSFDEGHTMAVTGLAWVPAAGKLYSCSLDQTVRCWDPSSRKLLHTLLSDASGHNAPVVAVCQLLDPPFGKGAFLVSAAADGSVKLWQLDPASGALAAVPGSGTGPDGDMRNPVMAVQLLRMTDPGAAPHSRVVLCQGRNNGMLDLLDITGGFKSAGRLSNAVNGHKKVVTDVLQGPGNSFLSVCLGGELKAWIWAAGTG